MTDLNLEGSGTSQGKEVAMRTFVSASLFVLLFAVAGLWAIQEAAPQAQEVHAWMLVDFERGNARDLWQDGGFPDDARKDRWSKAARDCYRRQEPRRPSDQTRIIRIDSVQRVVGRSTRWDPRRRAQVRSTWDAFVEIRAVNRNDLIRATQYIEQCYSHVESFRITGTQP